MRPRAQVGARKPRRAFARVEFQPVLHLRLRQLHCLPGHFEHRLVVRAQRFEAVTQAQGFVPIFQHRGIGDAGTLKPAQQTGGRDAGEAFAGEPRTRRAAA